MRNAITILVLAIFVIACDEKPPATTAPPLNLRPVSVHIDGPTQVPQAAEVQFTAVQTWSDGSTRDVTASALWTSSNPAVLFVTAGLAKALSGGEVGLTAQIEQLTSQPRSVRVVPSLPEWTGAYTLTIGGGPCNDALPLAPELRTRTYTAALLQSGLTLSVVVRSVGDFGGQIFNPQARFFFYKTGPRARRVHRASATEMFPDDIRLVSDRRFVYSGPPPGFIEVLDGYQLVITGDAITTMTSSGFAGILNGELSLYEPTRKQLIGVCASPSHGFTLVRK